jgi:PAS domain S-box-containing protein
MTKAYKLPFFLALIAAGLAGNHFKFPIFLDTDFLFGSIFAMLALQFFGIGRGIVAAALIASYTYILWNHPYAIITLTAEVAVVGWLMQRSKVGMVLADTLYWLIIGMPLAYLLYHIARHIPFSSDAYFIMTKQAVNGIANALVARLIYTGFALWSRSSLTSFRDLAYNLLAFFVVCPALIMLAVESENDFIQTDRNIRTALVKESKHVRERLNTWVTNRQTAIINLAEMAASRSPLEMQPFLEQAKKSDVNFLRIGLHNREAISTAYFPLIDELGKNTAGKNFADRPYIPVLKQTLKPMLSEVSLSKTDIPKPRVLLIAPVVIQGEYDGFVAGFINLEQIRKYLDISLDRHDTLYTLLDENGNVIMSNRTDQTVMTPFASDQGTLHRLDAEVSQWVPVVPPNTPTSNRWKKSFYVAETNLGELAEWKLVLEQPVAPFQKKLFREYSGKLTLLFFILLGALLLAEFISRLSLVTLERLRQITYNLPVKLMAENQEIAWPESGIKESNHLINNFKDMANSLTAQFNEIQQINESLERRVEERNVQLRESEERYRSILNACPDDITITDLEGRILLVSPAGLTMFGYDRQEQVTGKVINDFIVPEDRDRALANITLLFQGKLDEPTEYRGLRADGQPVSMVFVVRDISERKRVEKKNAKLEAENRQLQKAESLGMMAGAIAHHFNNQLSVVIGNLEIAINNRPLDAGPSPALTHAMQATLKAAEISRQMNTYLGQVTGKRTLMDLSEICRQSLPQLQTSVPKELNLTTNLPSPGPTITANAEQIQQVLNCLVTNAWESCGDKQGTIAITVKTISPGDLHSTFFPIGWQPQNLTYTCLEVKDTGCGIAEEDIDKLFDPFFSHKFTGRGLGLPIVLGIVKAYNGAVSVESATGRGSTFRVFLPSTEENP